MSLQPNISDTPFDQKCPRPPEGGVSRLHTQSIDVRYEHSKCIGRLANLKRLRIYASLPGILQLGGPPLGLWAVGLSVSGMYGPG